MVILPHLASIFRRSATVSEEVSRTPFEGDSRVMIRSTLNNRCASITGRGIYSIDRDSNEA